MARIRQRCATIRDIFEHLFFLVIAKVFGGTVAQGVFLDYKRWYKRIIAVPRQIFLVAQVAQAAQAAQVAQEAQVGQVGLAAQVAQVAQVGQVAQVA